MSISDEQLLLLVSGKQIQGERFSYVIGERRGGGGSSVVYDAQCEDIKNQVIIKFFVPVYYLKSSHYHTPDEQKKALEELVHFYQKELESLHQINHPGIVRVIDSGTYTPSHSELTAPLASMDQVNFLVTEFVQGPNIARYFKQVADEFTPTTPRRAGITSLFVKLCDALIYLHEVKQYLHADLIASNIIVQEQTGDPKIIDFALYKNFNPEESDLREITHLQGDWDMFPHLEATHPLKRLKETAGTREEFKSLCFPGLDLYHFGILLRELKPEMIKIFGSDEIRYIGLIAEELLSWEKVQDKKTITARWLKDQFSKLDPAYSHFLGVEELSPPSSAKHTFQLPGKVITVSPLIDRLANTHSFNRLRSINQLSLVDIIYPGAGYRRHLHCFRAYSYCAELIESLTQSPRFRLFFSPLLASQALAMALLHDINHFPFLHTIQEAVGSLLKGVDLLDLFCDGEATGDNPSIYELLHENVGLSREQFRDILMLSHQDLVEKQYDPGLQIVKSMLDSGADLDKLAYLEDDSRFTGVAYGRGVDATHLIASATVVRVPMEGTSDRGWHLGFRDGGLSAVESLVMARYWMFRTVYWHRVNRAVMAMLLHVLRKVVTSDADARNFVVDTMWQSEEEVLNYLNTKHLAMFNENCITHRILQDHRKVYGRLLSIQGSGDNREAIVYRELHKLRDSGSALQLEKYRQKLSSAIQKYVTDTLNLNIKIGNDDLLFDIPARHLGNFGAIYIELDTHEVRDFQKMPGVVGQAGNDFERMANRIRIFVRPEIGEAIGEERLIRRRGDLLKIVADALTSGISQVQ